MRSVAAINQVVTRRRQPRSTVKSGSEVNQRRVDTVTVLTGALVNDEHLQMIYHHPSEMIIVFI